MTKFMTDKLRDYETLVGSRKACFRYDGLANVRTTLCLALTAFGRVNFAKPSRPKSPPSSPVAYQFSPRIIVRRTLESSAASWQDSEKTGGALAQWCSDSAANEAVPHNKVLQPAAEPPSMK